MSRSIAYLTSVYARAGDTFIRREVEELRRKGWTVHTFSIRRAEESERVAAEVLREQMATDFILERGPLALLAAFLRMSLRSPSRMARAAGQAWQVRWPGLTGLLLHAVYLAEAAYLAERLLERRVTRIHNHISMNSATVAMLASTLAGIPFSMTVHGPHDFFAPQHWALASKIAAADLTICISSFGKSQCMLFAAPEHWKKLQVVRCGLDAHDLDREMPALPADGAFVSVGRLSPEKGQLLLVEAIALLRAQGLAAQATLVGDGPMRKPIEDRAAELGVSDAIQLLGWRSSEQVRACLAKCRTLVQPSFAEGIPVVLMEAMALGRPVIATSVGGVPELVRPGENGWLVPAGSVNDLASAMREALMAPLERLQHMGLEGRQRVRTCHDLSAEVGKLATLFEERSLLDSASASAGRGSGG